jgi:hypothetical protein
MALEATLLKYATEVPFVAIENFAFDGTGKAYVPKLSLSDDQWRGVASVLIGGARIIVFYISELTEGVVEEFEFISHSSRQADTVLVLDRKASPEISEQIHQRGPFLHAINWGDQKDRNSHDLENAVLQVLQQPRTSVFDTLPSLGRRAGLPEDLSHQVRVVAGLAMQEAQQHAEKGEILLGQNALVRCIVLCCLSGYDEGRARAFLELARAQFFGREKSNLARINYNCAIGTYTRLARNSEKAREMLLLAKQEREQLPPEDLNEESNP